jgi:hypothetical protein
METVFDEIAAGYPSAYYRWRDERSALDVEIRIELVPRILADLQAAAEMGLEGGGVLVGCFPRSIGPPLLRIEEFETVGRRRGDGLLYVLLAEQRLRFTTVRKKAATRELSAVGYFRSHLRTGAFELSVSDRDLMSAEFRNSIHVALLIGKDQSGAAIPEKERHLATYFVSVNGVIQNRVDPITFPFELEDLLQLALTQPRPPEIRPALTPAEGLTRRGKQAESATTVRGGISITGPPRGPLSRARRFTWAGVGLLALLTLLFLIWGWQRPGSSMPWSSTRLELSVATQASWTPGNQSLHVTWNHASPLVGNANKAVLSVSDRDSHKTVQQFELAPSDLAVGSVKLDMAAEPVEISLVLWMADATRVTQVAEPSSAVPRS